MRSVLKRYVSPFETQGEISEFEIAVLTENADVASRCGFVGG